VVPLGHAVELSAALYGLAIDASERQVLGRDVSIDVTPVDETNTRIKPNKLI